MNRSHRTCYLVLVFLFTQTYAQNQTMEIPTTEPATDSFDNFADNIYGDDSCAPAQVQLVYNCSIDFEEEINNFNNESIIIFEKIDSIFERNPLVFGTSQLFEGDDFSTDGTTESTTPQGELDYLDGENVTTIIEFLQREPEKTRQVLDHVCTAMGKAIKCADAGVRDTECNPIIYRFAKVFQKEFCNRTFLEIFLDSSACVFNTALQPKILACVERLNDTVSDLLFDVIIDGSSIGQSMCKITSLVYDCFASSSPSCSPELLNQSADIGGKFITAMFDYKCEITKPMEGGIKVAEANR